MQSHVQDKHPLSLGTIILAALSRAEKFYPYLVALRTDYTTLASFTKQKLVPSPKLQRYAWRQYRLSQYQFTIEIVLDKHHFLPDALTREMKIFKAQKYVWTDWAIVTPHES